MTKFLYIHFLCEQEELQDLLTLRGAEGWRLHTCEPVILQGQYGSSIMNVLVVMDQAFQEEEEFDLPGGHDDAAEGIAMKG